jgi:exodeoxyribonuclease VII large subunit
MFNPAPDLLTVSDITYRIKELLEYEPELQDIQIQGEVSNLTFHSSGHAYFTLKDEGAQLSCVLFRGHMNGQTRNVLKHGAKVILQGGISVYAQRGNYQLLVTGVKAYGLGDLYQQFIRLKEKLEHEGLFEAARKRSLPPFPRTIGVVTSPTGAVIQDILQTLARRYPCVNVVLAPAIVQGEQGAASVIRALHRLQKLSAVDVVIIARGGGSMEDLWCFNDEQLARVVYAYPLPVISAIGHETDFTILDFVADRRAATPTAAAENVVPDRRELLTLIQQMQAGIRTGVQYNLYNKMQLLDDLTGRLRLQRSHLFRNQRSELDLLRANLQQYNPRTFLEKGFSLVLKAGQTVTSAAQLKGGDKVEIIMNDGRLRSTIDSDD